MISQGCISSENMLSTKPTVDTLHGLRFQFEQQIEEIYQVLAARTTHCPSLNPGSASSNLSEPWFPHL